MPEREDAILVAIDDTDMPGTPGTGRRAREIAGLFREAGHPTLGVTRHQLLVDPRIPYTSHNSSACIAVQAGADVATLWEIARDHLLAVCADGSDPGLCVAYARACPAFLTDFGRRAQKEVLKREIAEALAQEAGVRLAGLAGTRDGLIGALAAVGLRKGGHDGRFIELGRVRDLDGTVSVDVICRAGVDRVVDPQGNALDSADNVATMNWVRPRLRNGLAVMFAERSDGNGESWKPVGRDRPKDRRKE